MSGNNGSKNGNAGNDRLKAIEIAIGQIEKQFGQGAIMRLGEAQQHMAVEVIPTGSLTLDIALGGGVPRGRITEIYGPEMAGKSTVAMHVVGEAQKAGGLAAYIDVEHAMDPTFAAAFAFTAHETRRHTKPDDAEQIDGDDRPVHVAHRIVHDGLVCGCFCLLRAIRSPEWSGLVWPKGCSVGTRAL